MSTHPNKKDAYLSIVKQMQNDLAAFSIPVEAPDEKTLMDTMNRKWNYIVKQSKKWEAIARNELKHSAFFRKFKYDTKVETLKHGRRILRAARQQDLKNTTAIKKQRHFIEELEDRLEFITAHY